LWQAKDAPVLYLEAAFQTKRTEAAVGWSNYNYEDHIPVFEPGNHAHFAIIGDGEFRTYRVDLSVEKSYRDALSYLYLKPVVQPEKGAWVKIKRIRLGK
jgi:hypothetical protein